MPGWIHIWVASRLKGKNMAPDDDKTRAVTALSEGTVINHYRIVEVIGVDGRREAIRRNHRVEPSSGAGAAATHNGSSTR